ncbi:ABC transporter ATP-binding protein [Klugiella xanthotipulae]|uniref:ABC-2 type transport system ATP-binding protein n=1 Tax=Klugiella xanthotipulae TaxID=244735 RepID=A0A543HT96_9MICO|nr:ABC transporter ATP-binding protein [Klugiella xanthotipulae]TQM61573.1 ABC-2 type transport system ATP-binding protein [Klugiella xanthotipulae]
MTLAIETVNLTKTFGSRQALRGVDLAIPTGSVFGVIGPNGSGKSTTMRILLDIVRPTSGSATVLGRSPREGGIGLRRRIGYLPGELILEGRVTGRALLTHYASISGPVSPSRVADLAERLGLDLTLPVRSLSKGNKQKLGIIQAFMHDPHVLVLDEPTSGLDPLVQQIFLDLVREARESGQTVFLSSHVLSEIEQVADEVAILREGRVVTTSTVERLREVAQRRVRASILEATPGEVTAHLNTIPGLNGLTVATAPDGTLSLTGTLEGEPDAFVKALAALHVHDVSIEMPNLEDAVLQLYSESDAEIAASGITTTPSAQEATR